MPSGSSGIIKPAWGWSQKGVNPDRPAPSTLSTASSVSRQLDDEKHVPYERFPRPPYQHRPYQYPILIYRFNRIMDRRYARSMKKFRLVTIAFVVVGTLNLLAFVYLSGHGEYAPTSYSQDYLSGS